MSLRFHSLTQKMFILGLLASACQSQKSSTELVNTTPVVKQRVVKDGTPVMQREFSKDECNNYPVNIIFIVDDKLDFRIERLPNSDVVNVYHAQDSKPMNKRISPETFSKVFDKLVASGYLGYQSYLNITHGRDLTRYTLAFRCGPTEDETAGFRKTVTYDSMTILDNKFDAVIEELKRLAHLPTGFQQRPKTSK